LLLLQFDPAAYYTATKCLPFITWQLAAAKFVQALIHFSLGLFLLSGELIEQGTSV
jgi:hypothetical protein